MKDEGLHEVQLNGKQLVFAFMVATVIAVVVFLLGVLVGRGLRPTARVDLTTATTESTIDPTLPEPSSSAAPPSSAGPPVSARESLDYAERLESPTPLPDDVSDPTVVAPPPAPRAPAAASRTPAATAKPTTLPTPVRAGTQKPDPALAEPSGSGFVVQVMAVTTRAEADAVARRLAGKGYPAFVTTTVGGAQTNYRVRVGKFTTQREADAISQRLQKEEQFKPWVTR